VITLSGFHCTYFILKSEKNLSLGISTVETNRDRDCPLCRDIPLKTVEIVFRGKIGLFFVLVEIFKIETFELRLICVEILIKLSKTVEIFSTVETNYLTVLRLRQIKTTRLKIITFPSASVIESCVDDVWL
jgi:hypothetical protein